MGSHKTDKHVSTFETSINFSDAELPTVARHRKEMLKQGYTVLSGDFYSDLTKADNKRHVAEIQSTFFGLKCDKYSPGFRQRAFDGFFYDPSTKLFAKTAMSAFQSQDVNPVVGGELREYDSIDEKLLSNPVFRDILAKDIELVRRLGLLKFDDTLLMRIIQNRYMIKDEYPSFAVPTWLHIDDETITTLHLLEITDNLIGGDAVITTDIEGNNVIDVLRLTNPLDTYMVTQKVFHAVTPMHTNNKADAHRHIFIVAFKNVSEEERKATVHSGGGKVFHSDNWIDVGHNSQFPSNTVSVSTNDDDKSLQKQHVALWYKSGEPVFGRAYNHNGHVNAWFPYGGKEWNDQKCGTFQLLANSYNYKWVGLDEANNSKYRIVQIGDYRPSLIATGNRTLLGKATNQRAWTCYSNRENVHNGDAFNKSKVLVEEKS